MSGQNNAPQAKPKNPDYRTKLTGIISDEFKTIDTGPIVVQHSGDNPQEQIDTISSSGDVRKGEFKAFALVDERGFTMDVFDHKHHATNHDGTTVPQGYVTIESDIENPATIKITAKHGASPTTIKTATKILNDIKAKMTNTPSM